MNPREGDMRAEWDCLNDCMVYAEFRDGAWNITRRVNRYDPTIMNEREYQAWREAGRPCHPAHFYVRQQQQQAAMMQAAQNALAQQVYWNNAVQQQNQQNALYQGGLGGYNQMAVNTGQIRELMMHGLEQHFYTVTAPPPEAIARAKELLVSHLDPTQKAQFEIKGDFEIVGGATKRTYRIASAPIPGKNVTWMESGKPRISYDAHPVDTSLPAGDIMLAQKLALENPEMESHFISIACKHDHNANPYDVDPALRYYRMYEQYGRIVQAAEPARPTIWGRLFGA